MGTFFVMWASQAVSLLGSAVVEFALAWYLTKTTGSATILATAMMVALIPQIVLGPIIGPFIDRWNRKRIMIFADFSITLVTIGLMVLFFLGVTQVWHIYVVMVLRAIGQAFHFPTMMASVPMVVPEKHLSRATGLNQMLQGIIAITGPPAGAFLMELLDIQWVLGVDILTAIVAIGCLLPIKIPQPEKTTLTAKASPIADMMQGFRYIWNWRGMTMLLALVVLLNFFSIPSYALLPILVTEHLGGEVLNLGWINSAFGFGAIAGGLLLGVWAGFKRRILTALLGLFISGIAQVVLGTASLNTLYVAIASSFVIGAGMSMTNGPLMAIMNSVIAKDMQGRVFSLMGSVSAAASPIGLAIAGPLADAAGIRAIFYIGGGATVLIAVASYFIPTIMNMEKQPSGADAEI